MSDVTDDAWVGLLAADRRPWLAASDEASARWLTLTALLDRPEHAPEVTAERQEVVADPRVQRLIARLPRWGDASSVNAVENANYLPRLLQLLADLGVRAGDDPRIEAALDDLQAHQFDDGRFAAFGRAPGKDQPLWHSMPCANHAITEALVRYGCGDRPPVSRALERIAADLHATRQGPGWTCIPDPDVGWRGPGRKGDVCPQVTLEALRIFSRLPPSERPDGLDEVAATMPGVWRRRGVEQPYSFGHGIRFKQVKWPPTWYGAYWMLDTLGRYPDRWHHASSQDRRSLAELVACLIAYNLSSDGSVTPKSVYRGFEEFSFGQKKQPSPIATALLLCLVRRFTDLTDDVAKVDITRLASSKGGTGTPRPPQP
jgi:hypothetical protein